MTITHPLRQLLIGAMLLLASGISIAGGNLDAAQSSIYFISTKNAAVAEVHHFRELSGSLDDTGQVELSIALDSVETLIPIRNERMRDMLFQTLDFPTATLMAKVDPAALASLKPGERMALDVAFTLSLHGRSREMQVGVSVTRLEGGIEVTTLAPLVVNAADFDLTGGIAKLQEVAALNSISTAVPVSARLVFAD